MKSPLKMKVLWNHILSYWTKTVLIMIKLLSKFSKGSPLLKYLVPMHCKTYEETTHQFMKRSSRNMRNWERSIIINRFKRRKTWVLLVCFQYFTLWTIHIMILIPNLTQWKTGNGFSDLLPFRDWHLRKVRISILWRWNRWGTFKNWQLWYSNI